MRNKWLTFFTIFWASKLGWSLWNISDRGSFFLCFDSICLQHDTDESQSQIPFVEWWNLFLMSPILYMRKFLKRPLQTRLQTSNCTWTLNWLHEAGMNTATALGIPAHFKLCCRNSTIELYMEFELKKKFPERILNSVPREHDRVAYGLGGFTNIIKRN